MPLETIGLLEVSSVTTGSSNTIDALNEGLYPFFDRSQIVKRSNKFLFDTEAVIVPGEGMDFIPRYTSGKFDLHQRAYAVIPKENIDGRYLYYAIMNNRRHFSQVATGSTVKSLRLKSFELMKIPYHDKESQIKISKILSAFDYDIEKLECINDNLLAILRTAVDKYFCYLPEDMPDNWRRVMLPELASIIPGYSYKGNELVECSEDALVTIKNFERNGGFKIEGYKDLEISPRVKDSQFVDLFDILVAHTDLTQGAEIIGNAEIILSKGKYNKLVASMDLVKIQPNGNVGRYLLAAFLSGYNFKGHCLGYVNGTTVLHLGKDATKEYAIALPSNQETLHEYDLFCKVIYHTISENMVEIEKLTELRDCLLPKLMSGEVDVSTIDLPIKYSFSAASSHHE